MAEIQVNRSDTFEVWRQKTNQLGTVVGDPADLDPSLGTNIIDSVNTVNATLESEVVRLDSRILALTIALG